MATLNRRLRQQYDFFYHKEPIVANLFLLLLKFGESQETQRVTTDEQLMTLLAAKFGSPTAYAAVVKGKNAR